MLVRQSEASLVLGLRLGLLSAGNGCMQVLRSMSTHLLNQRCIPARLGFGTTRPGWDCAAPLAFPLGTHSAADDIVCV